MNSQLSRQVVIDAWQAFASRDPEQIGAVFTPDAEWIAPPGNATALALDGPSHMVGREALVQFLSVEFRKLFTHDVKIDFKGVYADGERVVVEERMTAALADGRPYANDYCFVFELEGGKIRRVREYMDTAAGHRMIFG
jgi:ketosteroid isomerase-like protein